jgi:hypothetical protein
VKCSRTVALALVGLLLWVPACTNYKVIPVSEAPEHGKVRVTLTDGERETLREPWIDGDSIKAYTNESVGNLGPQQRAEDAQDVVVIPLDQVTEVEAKGTDVAATVILAVLGAGLVAAAIAAPLYEMCGLSC